MSDAQLGIDTGNVLWADDIRTLATITEATDYAEGVRRSSVAQFEKLGGQVVAEERYTSDITDFRSQLTKLFSADPDALHVAAQAEFSGGTIIKQARELGFDGPIYTEVVPIGATALEVAGVRPRPALKAITADLDPANQRAQDVLQELPGHLRLRHAPLVSGVWRTMTCISLQSASSEQTTTRMQTVSGIACTRSPGAEPSETTTASMTGVK